MTNRNGIYHPRTTIAQRELLFKIWEETGDINRACKEARVSRRTFYNWKSRFESQGYSGLQQYESRAPKNPNRKAAEIEALVIQLKQANPDWGKERIAKKLASQDQSSAISPNTVKRILVDAKQW